MSLLLFTYRHQDIIVRKINLNYRIDQLNRKLMDLQSYSAAVADGSVSMNDLLQCPASQLGRMTLFMNASNQAGLADAQEKFAFMSQIPGAIPQMSNSQLQQNYANMMFKSLYDQSKEKFAQQEAKLLTVEETKIQQEKAKLETQLKMLDSEEEEVSKAEDDGAKKSAPHFVA